MVEIVSSQVSKGPNSQQFKPKAGRRKVKVAAAPVSIPTLPVVIPTVQEEPVPIAIPVITVAKVVPVILSASRTPSVGTAVAIPIPIPVATSRVAEAVYTPVAAEALPASLGPTMTQLIRGPFVGTLSTREQQRLIDVKLKRKAKKPEVVVAKKVDKPAVKPKGIQMVNINGTITIDKSSLQISVERDDEDITIVQEDAGSRYVTSSSFKAKHRLKVPKWSPEMTARFFDGLSYFGTDFKLISYMFPAMLKYKAEETKNSEKVSQFLRERRKAPEEIRRGMLAAVLSKRDLEDSQYVNKRKSAEVHIPDLNKKEDVTVIAAEEAEPEIEAAVVPKRVVKEKAAPALVFKDLPYKVPSSLVSSAPKIIKRRKLKVVEEVVIPVVSTVEADLI